MEGPESWWNEYTLAAWQAYSATIDPSCAAWSADADTLEAMADAAGRAAALTTPRFQYLRDNSASGLGGFEYFTGLVLDDTGTDIIGYYAGFNSSIPPAAVEGQLFGGDVNILQPAFDEWEAFVAAQCVGDGVCIFSSGVFGFMSLLGDLSDFALSTVLICLLASFIVLVGVTANVMVAILATFCVTVVIFATLACIILAGFKNGMYESIFTILVVGMAIDYAVHLAHFYNEAGGSRYEKAQAALHGVGVSVLGGAITTMGAGVPLFFCVVIFLWTLANYVFFLATTAIFLSFTFLLPVFMICGPQGQQGDLRALFRGNLAGFIGCGGHKKLAPVPAPPAAVAAAAE